jgi:DNA-binding beta-propeller fold protein YncE
MRSLALLSVLLLVPLALAAIALSAEPYAIPGASGTVWVTERTPTASSVAAFDAATGQVLGDTPVGSTPIGVTVPHGTNKAYSSDEGANQLSVIDRDSVEVVRTIGMGPRPHHLIASPNGEYVYVGEFGWNQIGVVDTSLDRRVTGYVASEDENARTHAVDVTDNGKFLYATNEVANSISKLDARTGELLWEITIGNRPSEILVNHADKIAYVSVRNEDAIKIVDVSGDRPIVGPSVAIGTQPDTLQLTNDGKTLVVGLRAIPQMALMDTETLAIRAVTVPGHGISGHEWLSASGKFTFIALESPGSLAVIDNESGEMLRDTPYPTGLPRPHGVFYEPRVLR